MIAFLLDPTTGDYSRSCTTTSTSSSSVWKWLLVNVFLLLFMCIAGTDAKTCGGKNRAADDIYITMNVTLPPNRGTVPDILVAAYYYPCKYLPRASVKDHSSPHLLNIGFGSTPTPS
jgi:hypothetical protein